MYTNTHILVLLQLHACDLHNAMQPMCIQGREVRSQWVYHNEWANSLFWYSNHFLHFQFPYIWLGSVHYRPGGRRITPCISARLTEWYVTPAAAFWVDFIKVLCLVIMQNLVLKYNYHGQPLWSTIKICYYTVLLNYWISFKRDVTQSYQEYIKSMHWTPYTAALPSEIHH